MKRVLTVFLATVFVLSVLTSGSVLAVPKATLQFGFGANQVQGAPLMGLDWKNPMVHAAGMYFPKPWAALIADVSYGLPNEYEQTYDTDNSKITAVSYTHLTLPTTPYV